MSDDDLASLLAAIAGRSKVTPLVGTFVSASTAGCVVDVGGGRVNARFGSDYLPEVNEPVNVLFIDTVPFMMGPVGAKAGRGTVLSVAASLVTLKTDYGNVTCPYGGAAPSTGQIMKITWRGGAFAEAVMSTSPTPGTAPLPPTTGATAHTDTFTALDAASHNSNGWWTSDVRADDSDLSAWFYGSKIGDTLPAAAQIQSVQIFISAVKISGNAPNFALHPHQNRPSGAPTLTSATAIAASPGWVTLPAAFGAALRAAGGSAGVGVAHGGLNIFNSLASDGQSGALRITSTY